MVKKFTKEGKSCEHYVEEFEERMALMKQNYPKLVTSHKVVHECKFVDFLKGKYSTEFDQIFKKSDLFKKQFFKRLVPRHGCLPGQKILLHLCWNKEDYPEENFYYFDLNMAFTYALRKFR